MSVRRGILYTVEKIVWSIGMRVSGNSGRQSFSSLRNERSQSAFEQPGLATMKPPAARYFLRFSRSFAFSVKAPSPDQTQNGVLKSASAESWTGTNAGATLRFVSLAA